MVEPQTKDLLILRAAALAFWLACVLFLVWPAHAKSHAPFQGGQPFVPKYTPARGL